MTIHDLPEAVALPTDAEAEAAALMELKMRLLRRPLWSPAMYEGICSGCGAALDRGEPVYPITTARGVLFLCWCIVDPEKQVRPTLSVLRRTDLLTTR